MSDTDVRYKPYAPRTTAYHGIRKHAGHRLKTYSIRCGDEPISLAVFDEGIAQALSELPEARPEDGRPGLGFLILHRGHSMNYVVLAWWAFENELPIRVQVQREGEAWRDATEESFCVWDLEIMARERDAYVETVLNGTTLDPWRAYMEHICCDVSDPLKS